MHIITMHTKLPHTHTHSLSRKYTLTHNYTCKHTNISIEGDKERKSTHGRKELMARGMGTTTSRRRPRWLQRRVVHRVVRRRPTRCGKRNPAMTEK